MIYMEKSTHANYLDRLSRIFGIRHYKTPEEKCRRSKGEMPKCKTCQIFDYCHKADGRTMKTACVSYDRRKK